MVGRNLCILYYKRTIDLFQSNNVVAGCGFTGISTSSCGESHGIVQCQWGEWNLGNNTQ